LAFFPSAPALLQETTSDNVSTPEARHSTTSSDYPSGTVIDGYLAAARPARMERGIDRPGRFLLPWVEIRRYGCLDFVGGYGST
jgi:hypothetical protein